LAVILAVNDQPHHLVPQLTGMIGPAGLVLSSEVVTWARGSVLVAVGASICSRSRQVPQVAALIATEMT
jgi:hypothetical protein